MLRARLATLVNSADPGLRKQGREELEALLKKAGDVRAASEHLKLPERTVHRWIRRCGAESPRPRGTVTVGDGDIRAAIKKAKSVSGAARELGVSHTTVWRRAAAMGLDVPDGRANRPVRPRKVKV